MNVKHSKKPVKKSEKPKAKPKPKLQAKPKPKKRLRPKGKMPAVLPVKPAPVPAPKAEAERQMGSIESAKKEFLLQRTAVKKPQSFSHPPVNFHQPAVARPAFVPTLKPKTAPAVPTKKKESATISSPTVSATAISAPAEPARARRIQIQTPVTVKDLAAKLFVGPSELIQKLIKLNIFATINQSVNFEIAGRVAKDLGFELEAPKEMENAAVKAVEEVTDKSRLVMRAPIVTLMGHVDHGKTSLLDTIRKTKVAAGEAGGITQHIGAYEVFLPKGAVTFLDTPGHEAFTAMRARGARATDVVVLVVAADDGVMPQTIEAIDHARAAGVPIIVAINKIDLPSANTDRVKKALMEHNLMSEDWGGKTIMVGVSAKTGQGVDELLEMLVLESDLLELKANPESAARGVVIEAEVSKESGVLATLLVQDGTLRVGDVVIVEGAQGATSGGGLASGSTQQHYFSGFRVY